MGINEVATLLASLAVLLVVAGLIVARDRRRHVPLMLAAFAIDLVGLLLVELTPLFRGETDPVTGLATDFTAMKGVHAAFATASLVGYVLQIRSGRKVLAGDRVALIGHKKVAKFFIVTRALAYVTMYMV